MRQPKADPRGTSSGSAGEVFAKCDFFCHTSMRMPLAMNQTPKPATVSAEASESQESSRSLT
jgi:hypothetical protein